MISREIGGHSTIVCCKTSHEKMATKTCSYRNCSNKSTTHPELTYFGFPLKDERKCKKWADLAGCDPYALKNQHLCEEHFSSIYLSKTPRRTVLLPLAVPYSYNDSKKEISSPIDERYTESIFDPIPEDNIVENYSEGDNQLPREEESREEKSDPLLIPIKIVHQYNEVKRLVRLPAQVVVKKLTTKHLEASQLETSRPVIVEKKRKISDEEEVVILNPEESFGSVGDDEKFVVDNISTTSEISTFNFRGEECLQMPKRKYLEQREELINEINKYKTIVMRMKELLNESFND